MSLHVVKPGMLTTVQDLGRWGYQNLGVPVAGPMDHASHRLANLLVGNRSTAATLEVTWLGPELEFEQAVACALTGAEFDLMLDGRTVARNAVWQAARGSRLTIGARRRGARAYLAVKGGIAVPRYLGSRATHVASRMGGLHGRALEAGDRLPIGSDVTPITQRAAARSRRPVVALPDGGARVRVMLGPQDHVFSEAGDRDAAHGAVQHHPAVEPDGVSLDRSLPRGVVARGHAIGRHAAWRDSGAGIR